MESEEKRSARARVEYAQEELRAAKDALAEIERAEADARDAALFAEAQSTGDLSKLPRCEFFDICEGDSGPEARSCSKIATRAGGCEWFYICDEHKCRHELPWAALARASTPPGSPRP